MIKKIIVFLIVVLTLGSCASSKKMVYLNNVSDSTSTENLLKYANTLQPDDNIIITVTADEPSLAAPFNLMYLTLQSNQLSTFNSNDALISYLIDQNGEIDFPVLGKIKLAGLTRIEAENKIKDLLKEHIVNPGVNLRVINFEVSVLGEVSRPGTVKIAGDRLTIFEAISSAGDLTIYGKRQNIMVIREKDGVKSVNYVDITDSSIIDSPYYYLSHNDIVYVSPNKTKINSSVIGPNLTVGLSAISLIVTIIALSTR